MDKKEELDEENKEKHSSKSSSRIINSIPKKIIFSVIILLVLPVLVLVNQKPQIFLQQAATNHGAPNSCNAYFYCLTLGNAKSCNHPSICPVQPPSAFVAQSNNVASGSGNQQPGGNTNPPNASGSGGTVIPTETIPTAVPVPSTCPKPPAELTTKLIIHFDTAATTVNGYTIRAVDMPALDKFAAAMIKYPTATITINGYTDSVPFAAGSTGSVTTNQQLSLARAQAAETYLKSKGATKNAYVVKGNGAANPVAPNGPNGNLLNRRDEITTNLTANSCTPVATKFVQPKCTNNSVWSGYYHKIPAKTTKASLETTWKVSTVTCSGNLKGLSEWAGIDAGKAVAQLGTDSICTNTKASYDTWTENFPSASVVLANSKYPVNAGDQYTASVTMTKAGTFTTTITNVTRKWSLTKAMTLAGTVFQDDIVLENDGYGVNPQIPGMTKFTQAPFYNSTFSENGGTTEPFDLAPGLTCTNLNATGNILEANTSNMTNANFTETWVHQ